MGNAGASGSWSTRLVGWLVGWLAGCSRDKSVDMLGESLVGWLINSMIQHLNGGLIGLLIV